MRLILLLFRWVYKWFLLVYNVCYGLGIAGYFCILLTFLGFNILLAVRPDTAMNFGMLLLFYGLYFGVVSRDFSETCTEMMASSIGVSWAQTKHHTVPN